MFSGDSKSRSVLRLLGLAEPPLYESGFPVSLQAWYIHCRTHTIVSHLGEHYPLPLNPLAFSRITFSSLGIYVPQSLLY